MMNCRYCGYQLNGENFCPHCGSPVSYDQNHQMYVNQGLNPNGIPTGLPKDEFAIISFVCGLISFNCCAILAIPGIICSIISAKDVKEGRVDPGNKTLGTIGLVLSIIGIIGWIIAIIYIAIA